MSHFDFKNLMKRAVRVLIPKEFVYCIIGAVVIILLVLITSNMYLQEMLFFEGKEKSIQYFTEEELREYGDIYKDLSLKFQNRIGAVCQDYANRTNRAGERIHYGVYNREHPTDDTGKIKRHSNGQNINAADYNHISDYNDSLNTFEVKDSYIESGEFKNGISIKYAKTEGRGDGESNYKDILTMVSMILDQKQTRDGENDEDQDIKEKIPKLIKEIFNLTHTFSGESKELYACEKGCRVLFYYCNEIDNRYSGTGIDLKPFFINPHNDFDDYSEEDFEIVSPYDECVICEHNGKGCVVDSERCYHGSGSDEDSCKHAMGSECENSHAHHICSYDGDGEHDCSDSDTGCGGHYDCDGHEHYNCPGHFYVCCMGHTDLTINIKIMYIDEMINYLQNGISIS